MLCRLALLPRRFRAVAWSIVAGFVEDSAVDDGKELDHLDRRIQENRRKDGIQVVAAVGVAAVVVVVAAAVAVVAVVAVEVAVGCGTGNVEAAAELFVAGMK